MNTFIWGNDIWSNFNSNVDWQRRRLSYTPLVMSSYVRNAQMFKLILEKSDLTIQMKTNQFPLEQITEYLIASITHDTFEKNEMLMNFTQKIFYSSPDKMDKFVSYYNFYQDYDLNKIIKTIRVDNKKLDLNKIKNFSNEFVSYFEKIQLERS